MNVSFKFAHETFKKVLKHTRPHCSCTTYTQDGSIAPKLPRVTTHERVQPENEPSSSKKIKLEKVTILQKRFQNNSRKTKCIKI